MDASLNCLSHDFVLTSTSTAAGLLGSATPASNSSGEIGYANLQSHRENKCYNYLMNSHAVKLGNPDQFIKLMETANFPEINYFYSKLMPYAAS